MSTPAEAAAGGRFPAGATVAAVGEHALIAAIRNRIAAPPAWLHTGIGDDAAVLEPSRGDLEVLTTDSLVEGIHFLRSFSSPFDIGWKALAVNVSDVAAMGARPRAALLSLALPPDLPAADVDGILDGFLALAGHAGVTLIGGNITRSPGPLVLDVTLTGAVRRRSVLRRSGAKAGDAVYVTGHLGLGRAGLDWLRETGGGAHASDGPESLAACADRHRRPDPRYRIGMLLGRSRAATACMDLSDGLADGLSQVAAASGVGLRIDAAALPLSPAASAWFASRGAEPTATAVAGGDDYELLFTVSRKARGRLRHVVQHAGGVAITRIGEVTSHTGQVVIVRDGAEEPLPSGFVHF